jgi:hypothetical protein
MNIVLSPDAKARSSSAIAFTLWQIVSETLESDARRYNQLPAHREILELSVGPKKLGQFPLT